MAIKPCKECGGPVSDKAESCPLCGAKKKKKSSFIAWLGLVLVVLAGIGMCTQNNHKRVNSDSQTSVTEADKEPKQVQNWEYKTTKDDMRNKTTEFATTVSDNTVDFEFPYDGGSKLILTLRQSGKETDVMITISKGQILCGISGCEASFKFDDGPVQAITMVEPDSHASDVLFVMYDKTENKIISQLKNSKKITIEVPFYREGRRQFTFSTDGLNWNH
ncbi:hypothetical protein G9F31_00790 [Acinetobacter sp. 187]|uniref:hypothetical protein n=1 Tax=Acinetobacter lanii TaxID=2715163 RepID=UPI001409F252|nr:hypothetical protein [Acinetobacter lanii]NHC02321.1 hypothetical protein [Acinetobacter lanii]